MRTTCPLRHASIRQGTPLKVDMGSAFPTDNSSLATSVLPCSKHERSRVSFFPNVFPFSWFSEWRKAKRARYLFSPLTISANLTGEICLPPNKLPTEGNTHSHLVHSHQRHAPEGTGLQALDSGKRQSTNTIFPVDTGGQERSVSTSSASSGYRTTPQPHHLGDPHSPSCLAEAWWPCPSPPKN